MHERRKKGNEGERLACEYLRACGYQIIATQWRRLPLGEIDIVASERGMLVFVEVKSRGTNWYGTPEESVTRAKRAKIARLIDLFRSQHTVLTAPYRFDIIGIECGLGPPIIRHLKAVGIDW